MDRVIPIRTPDGTIEIVTHPDNSVSIRKSSQEDDEQSIHMTQAQIHELALLMNIVFND